MSVVPIICSCLCPRVNCRRLTLNCRHNRMSFLRRILPRFHVIVQYLLVGIIYTLIHNSHFHVDHSREHIVDARHKRALTALPIHTGSPSMAPLDGGFVAPNQILKSTAIGVKTFNRPECLTEFITSVRLYAPYLTIFVIDDSDQDARTLFLRGQDQGDVYVMLPTDSGTGYGRNRIVEAIHKAGFEYLIMADDDFKIATPDTIPMLAKHLMETGADVVAATRCDLSMDNCKRNKGMVVIDEHRNLTIVPNVTMYPPYEQSPTCFRSDLVQQFFMARTDSLLRVHWDDHLKNNDHYDFLLSAKQADLALVTCTDVQVLHEKSCEAQSIHGERYKETRERRWYQLLEYIMRKWSLERIYDEVGKILMLDEHGNGVATAGDTVKYRTKSPETRTLIGNVVDSMNGYQPGWNWIRPLFSDKTWVMRKEFGPCVHLVSGLVEYEFDRYKTFNNKMSSTKFSQFMFNESCPFAERLWQLRYHGKIDDRARVYYITAVADDNHYLKRLLTNLDSDTNRRHITLVIVVMDNQSVPVVRQNKQMVGFDVVIVDAGPPFSRSIGLRIGFQKAMELAHSRGDRNAIGFAVDTSIIMPPDFSARIRHSTQCGLSAFSPIVFKCVSCNDGNLHNHSDGYWVYSGFGMMGFCLEDYVKVGGWGTTWGYRWGGEDVDIMERTVKHLPFVFRAKEEGYIYVRDPAVKQQNPGYYKTKNLFPRSLPPASLTTKMNNRKLGQRLVNFARASIPELNNGEYELEKVSRSYAEDAKGTLYYVTISNRDDERDRRWFLIHSYLSPILPS